MHRMSENCVINSENINTSSDENGHQPPSSFSPASPLTTASPSTSSRPPPPATSSPEQQKKKEDLTILHFNDVYNIEGRDKDPVGGAARFKTALDSFSHLNPLTLFSGDALSPSNISVVMKGEQMVPVLNSLDIQCAVYGNHDFDFGEEHLVQLAGEMNFPWLMSNARCAKTGELLACGEESRIITWGGWKIGLMGLVEMEWIDTLGTLESADVDYTDFVEVGQRLVTELQQEGCDLIIALTHMRVPNDLRLAREVPGLHMVLGGHDHHYEKQTVGDVLVLKSGSEFREFSSLTVKAPGSGEQRARPEICVEKHEVTSTIQPDPEMAAIVDKYLGKVQEGMEVEIGHLDCTLEGRFKHVRTRETNLGNLVTDIMRRTMKADVALLNSGTLRSDSVHETGVFKMKDLLSILPIVDSIMLLELTGQQLLGALENGVSQYPKHEGRFPQVSGVSFSFDPTQPIGKRIIVDSVRVGGAPLQEDKIYKLCTKGYIGQHGKDGYDIFRDCKKLVPADEGPILFSMVRDHFEYCLQLSRNNYEGTDGPGSWEASDNEFEDRDMRINPQLEGRITCNPHSESSGSE